MAFDAIPLRMPTELGPRARPFRLGELESRGEYIPLFWRERWRGRNQGGDVVGEGGRCGIHIGALCIEI